MTAAIPDAAENLAFLRALAQSGRKTPLSSGPYLLAAGLLFGVTSLFAWGMSLDRARFAPSSLTWLWLGAGALYVPVTIVLGRSRRVRQYGTTTANRAIRSVWLGISIGIAAMFACTVIVAIRAQSDLIWTTFPSLILALYGAGWTATAYISGHRWLHGITVACVLAAIACALTVGMAATFLLYAVLLLGVVALPGYLLMRSERS